jgi:hypothetical protein
MALIDGEGKRHANVIAMEPITCMLLDTEQFEEELKPVYASFRTEAKMKTMANRSTMAGAFVPKGTKTADKVRPKILLHPSHLLTLSATVSLQVEITKRVTQMKRRISQMHAPVSQTTQQARNGRQRIITFMRELQARLNGSMYSVLLKDVSKRCSHLLLFSLSVPTLLILQFLNQSLHHSLQQCGFMYQSPITSDADHVRKRRNFFE